MENSHVELERVGRQGRVLLLRLNRPSRANAYTADMLGAIAEAVQSARYDASVRALVVTGAGRNFCAGADRDELDRRSERDGLTLLSRDVFDLLANAVQPVLAAINGPAVAGGFELALAADYRVCAPEAFFKLPEVALGLAPAAGGIRRLIDRVGSARAKEIVMFEQRLDARTAESWGLVAAISADPVALAVERADAIAARDALCVSTLKMLIDARSAAPESIAQALLYGQRKAQSER